MSRRRVGRPSRRDRYGIDDEEKLDETNVEAPAAVTPYQLATDDGVSPVVGAPRDPTPTAADNAEKPSMLWKLGRRKSPSGNGDITPDEVEPLSPQAANPEVFEDEPEDDDDDGNDDDDDDDDSLEGYDLTLQELMYSTSSFYAIVIPGKSDLRVMFWWFFSDSFSH